MNLPALFWNDVASVISSVLVLCGCLGVLIGAIGVVRFPDFYTRLHAGGVIDTLGAELILVGLAFQGGGWQPVVKLVIIMLFLLITSPTATHAAAHAAHTSGLRPLCGPWLPKRGADGK